MRSLPLLAIAAAPLILAAARAGPPLAEGDPPQLTHVGAVAPDILGLSIRAGRAEYGSQVPYEAAPGDYRAVFMAQENHPGLYRGL
ncbi:MAG: hypothetical protein ACE5R4_01125 [Armatimonadota bacterium]